MRDSFYLIERIPLSIHNRSFLDAVDIPPTNCFRLMVHPINGAVNSRSDS
jgi:hypothetical protein